MTTGPIRKQNKVISITGRKEQKLVYSDVGQWAPVPKWLLQELVDNNLPLSVMALYVLIGLYADDKSDEAFTRRKRMAKDLNVTENTIDRWKGILVDLGALRVTERFRDDGSNSSNLYKVIYANPHQDND